MNRGRGAYIRGRGRAYNKSISKKVFQTKLHSSAVQNTF